ncbi:MAG TPA: hypothetical protein PLL20_04240 [Phycisphaerae bacterium]|nr:hypothetical protein [Phycisphaerae bacterium]HRR85663.1 hypothetical protein [Phycisphaerae bacterium]
MGRILRYAWAGPASLLGILFVPLALVSGGGVCIIDGVVEVHGGIVARLLRLGVVWGRPAMALTLGHVVLGCDAVCLSKTRAHERVHVGQYERWGPLFIPLYLGASLVVLVAGRDPYRGNPFEREAFMQQGP